MGNLKNKPNSRSNPNPKDNSGSGIKAKISDKKNILVNPEIVDVDGDDESFKSETIEMNPLENSTVPNMATDEDAYANAEDIADGLNPIEDKSKIFSQKKATNKKRKSQNLNKDESKLPVRMFSDESEVSSTGQKSLVSKDPLTMYLNEIRKYPLLSREDELALAKKYYESKDPLVAQTLVQSNLRFVVKVAAEYSKFGSRLIDLIQEGNVGLMHAVREFNPYRGTRLISYAVWWIRGYIQEFLMRQYSMVRIGTTQNQRKLFYQLQKQKNLLDSVDFETNIETISEKLGIPEDEVRDMAQRLSHRDLELDRPLSEDSSSNFGDLKTQEGSDNLDEQIAKRQEIELLHMRMAELRPTLNEREIILLEERILNEEPLTLQEIGEKYGITREAVRQAEVRLMKKIKEKMESK